jgi:putative tryptophan/tyrosine transport system substrate-binding protein
MRRREFIAGLGGVAASAGLPVAARAQQAAIPTVGWLRDTTAAGSEHMVAGFRKGLSETDYFEGQNVIIEYRWADNQPERRPELVADLIRQRVAVIATIGGNLTALAAKAATSTIPIVFLTGGDPVPDLVTSLSRPTGNLTGVTTLARDVDGKRLDLLLKLAPEAKTISGLVAPQASVRSENLRDAAGALGRKIALLEVNSEREFEGAFAKLAELGTDVLFVGVAPLFTANRDRLIALAARYSIPASYQDRDFTVAGGLMSYGTNIPDATRQTGVYVGRILRGARSADLPVLQPTKLELVINLKTAKALGLEIPPGVLALADEVVE